MTFYVGQKVVCIKDARDYYQRRRLIVPTINEIFPVLNHVYTIRGLYWNPIVRAEGCWLYEINNARHNYSDGLAEANFHVAWFRPLDERKTDISIFQKMLIDKEVTPCL